MLLVVMIGIYRENIGLLQLAAQQVNDSDKVKSGILLPMDKSEVSGSDVVATIRYFNQKPGPAIKVVRTGGGTMTYNGEGYDPALFQVPYNGRYMAEYFYDGFKEPVLISYIEK